MTMRFFLIALLLGSSGSALAAERRYSVTDFDRIQVDGPYQVVLTTGAASSARAIGSPAALERLSIDVQGRTLRVRANNNAWGGYPGAPTDVAAVTLTTRDLQAATVNGSGALTIDRAKGLKLSISLIGSGRAAIRALESDNLFVNMLGSGTMNLSGKTKTLRAELHGAASLDAAGLVAADAQLFADSAGDIKLAVSRAVTVQATGAGDVTISGSPACTVKISGSGQVRCGR
jgi:hypothetical protein